MLIRIIVGAVGIALAALVIETGGTVFALAVLALAVIGWIEYTQAMAAGGAGSANITGIVAMVLLWGCAWLGNAEEFMAVSVFVVLAVLLETVLFRAAFAFDEAAFSIAGIFYIGLPLSHLVMLRMIDGESMASPLGDFSVGCALVWIMFIGTWASDTFAYFVGSAIGRHKLCPTISPNKTVEGFLGSLVGTSAAVAGLGAFFSLSVFSMAALGFFIAVFATLGDLVESVLKRHVGIKDSGRLIPGHGGVLDRFDSVLFTAPFVYYFAILTSFFEG